MNENKTSHLDSVLKSARKKDFKKVISENNINQIPTLSSYLNQYIGDKGLNLASIVKESQLSKDYAYAIFNGQKKTPSRDRVIAICRAMNMSFEDTQRTLKIANVGILYSKNIRDAAIISSINDNDNVMELNSFLCENELDPLETSKAILDQIHSTIT